MVSGYRLVGMLGQGATGIVYKAVDLALKRPVALKMIASEHATAQVRHRLRTEAQSVARLQHPGIVQIYDVGEHQGSPYLALELVEHGTLADQLKRHNSLPARDAALMIAAVSRAVQHAHERGVIHRDLKPANVLMAIRERPAKTMPANRCDSSVDLSPPVLDVVPKVADFGLAKWIDEDQGRTRSGAIIGTPAYMAPEQAEGQGRHVGPAADVHALGAMLCECLTGRPPFIGASSWEVLSKVINEEPAPPSVHRPRLARDLDTICLKALSKDPALRYTAGELAEDLERFSVGEMILARPESRMKRAFRKFRRRPLLLVGTVLLLAMLTVLGCVQYFIAREAVADFEHGRDLARTGSTREAHARFERGLDRIRNIPFTRRLGRQLVQAQLANSMRDIADQLRYNYSTDQLNAKQMSQLSEHCQSVWSHREQVLLAIDANDQAAVLQIRADLLDIATLSSQLQVRLAPADQVAKAHEEAVARLDEAERLFGLSPALVHQRKSHERALKRAGWESIVVPTPRSASEYHLLGRSYRDDGELTEAARMFDEALKLDPNAIFLHYDRAETARKLKRFDDAVESYTACLTLRPNAICYYRRGVALSDRVQQAGDSERVNRDRRRAQSDFEKAMADGVVMPFALYSRGMLFHHQGDLDRAIADLGDAIQQGYPAAHGYYNLAIVQEQAGRRGDAVVSLQKSLEVDPSQARVEKFLRDLQSANHPPFSLPSSPGKP